MSFNEYKTPAEVKDYTINWLPTYNPPLAADEIIATSAWNVGGAADLIIGPPLSSFTNTTATVWLSGGTISNVYIITNTITTSQGRTFTDSFRLTVNATNPPDL